MQYQHLRNLRKKQQSKQENTPPPPPERHEKVSKNTKGDDEVEEESALTRPKRRRKEQCKLSNDHKTCNFLALKEESNSCYLVAARLLNNEKFSKCSKILFKHKAHGHNKELHTIISNMKLVLHCKKFLAYGHVKYNFCIYFDCKVEMELGNSSRASK